MYGYSNSIAHAFSPSGLFCSIPQSTWGRQVRIALALLSQLVRTLDGRDRHGKDCDKGATDEGPDGLPIDVSSIGPLMLDATGAIPPLSQN
jgi:hypothetical protein